MKNAGKQGALRAWKRSQVREEQYPKVACQRNAEGGEHIRERAHCGSHIRKVRVCAHVPDADDLSGEGAEGAGEQDTVPLAHRRKNRIRGGLWGNVEYRDGV